MATSLPEPNFIDRDPAAITLDMIAAYEAVTGRTLYPAQVERLVIDMIAYRETLCRIGIQEAAKQNLVSYATYPMLDYLGELVGAARLAAAKSRTTIRFHRVSGTTGAVAVPAGTQVGTSDGVAIFTTLEDATVPGGSATVDVIAECNLAGAVGNRYKSGTVRSLLTPIALIDYGGVANLSDAAGGQEIESDEHLRDRIRLAVNAFSVAGPKDAYLYWVKTAHQDIVDAAICGPEDGFDPGEVHIFPLTRQKIANEDDSVILAAVEDLLADREIRPLTDQVIVATPTALSFSLAAEVTRYTRSDGNLVAEGVEQALQSLAESLKNSLGGDLVKTQAIKAVMNVAGVYDALVTLTVGGSSTERRVALPWEWPACSTITVTLNPVTQEG